MQKTAVEIETPDGVADGYVFTPKGEGPFPGVIFLVDIGGIREANLGMAERLAGEGFVVAMPNPFYRTGRGQVLDFGAPREELMKRFGELATPLTPQAVAKDESAFVDFLERQAKVKQGAYGVVGYCFTGAHAMRAAAARPDKIAAAASFHGGRLLIDGPDSPHLLLPEIKARLYFGHAVQDQSMTAEQILKFEDALGQWGGHFASETYEGALHGWTVPGRADIYNQPQAELAHEKLTAFLHAALK
ncbi:hypothetical protein sos41_18750 [Alphaproteobacteria bacterium SO-S41]|nr:hypothetical protein sos41_18750 [Alphaproteobacteria bacterium SO-S41]